MKQLKEITLNLDLLEVSGNIDAGIKSVCFDSRRTEPGSLFIAVKGTALDGHDFIEQAIKDGAVAVVCEKLPKSLLKNITYLKVKDAAEALGNIASAFYDYPSKMLKLIGVTGTNGKTTVATLLYEMFRSLGYNAGLVSTVKYKINNTEINATHTTPDALSLNSLLGRMVSENCSHCFMEVSSHSVVQKRIAGLEFAGGVFTNITHDHLDYHKTFDEYIKAKKGFFDSLNKDAFALTNIDDRNGNVMLRNSRAKTRTYSLQKMADFRAKVMLNEFSGLEMNIDGNDVWCRLIGRFNAYNILAIYASAVLLGEEKTKVLTILSGLNPVEGRFECFRSEGNITSVVDYAHTPDALSNVINTILNIRKPDEKLITVVGCGGDRDRAKRPVMAGIASQYSDMVILTSDNPRSEVPEMIIDEMEKGVEKYNSKKVLKIVNRKDALKVAVSLAKPGDIILVAGKGHETYQEIKGVKYPFDDRKIIKEIMNMQINSH